MIVLAARAFYRRIGLEHKVLSLNRKLDKKIFYDFADLNKQEKGIITKYIERIELTYLLTAGTINIQPFITDEYHYEGIMVVTVQVREEATEKQIAVIEEIIHGTLPNPVLLTFQQGEYIIISTCMKRLNKVDKSNVVMGDIHHTSWIRSGGEKGAFEEFVQSVHVTNISFANFFAFYKEMDQAVQALWHVSIVGRFQMVKDEQQREEQQRMIKEIIRLEQEIRQLKASMKKESQFNKKVEYTIQIQQVTKKMDELKKQWL